MFNAGSVPVENAEAIQALLECLTGLDSLYLARVRDVRTLSLRESGVYYDRTEVWDTIPALYARGYGDCKSLACCLAAERRLDGRPCQPVFQVPFPTKRDHLHITYHILNLSDDGWEDPSKVCGMTDNENSYFKTK